MNKFTNTIKKLNYLLLDTSTRQIDLPIFRKGLVLIKFEHTLIKALVWLCVGGFLPLQKIFTYVQFLHCTSDLL